MKKHENKTIILVSLVSCRLVTHFNDSSADRILRIFLCQKPILIKDILFCIYNSFNRGVVVIKTQTYNILYLAVLKEIRAKQLLSDTAFII